MINNSNTPKNEISTLSEFDQFADTAERENAGTLSQGDQHGQCRLEHVRQESTVDSGGFDWATGQQTTPLPSVAHCETCEHYCAPQHVGQTPPCRKGQVQQNKTDCSKWGQLLPY